MLRSRAGDRVPPFRRSVIGGLLLALLLSLLVAPAPPAEAASDRRVSASVVRKSVDPGAAITVKARVSGFTRTPIVRLQERREGRWVTVKRLTRTSKHHYRTTLKRKTAGVASLRVLAYEWRSGKRKVERRSPIRKVRVRAVSTITASQSATETTGKRILVEGRVSPALPGARMTLQRKTGARWVDVQSIKPDARGRFSLRLWPGEGDAVFRVSRAAQDRSTRAVSGWIRTRGVEPSVCVQPLAGDAELRQSLRDRLARSSEHPVVIVGAGSSTTSGSGASQEMNRWLNRFAAALSADFDLSGNLPAPVLRQDAFGWSEPRETSGIHVVNVGVGGATSETYLLRGSPETRLSRVAGLAPDIVVHFVGSNDYRKSRDPVADYTPDLRRSIEELDGLLEGGEKPIHVLVHAYRPMRPTGLPFPWAAYRDAMAQVAAEDPERRVSIDLSKWFTDAGATASDPWNLIRSDLVHPTDAGHEALDGLIRRALDLNRDC